MKHKDRQEPPTSAADLWGRLGARSASEEAVVTGTQNGWSILIRDHELLDRMRELGRELDQALAGTIQPPVFIGILKGSTVFYADLIRHIAIDLVVDFMSISSYAETSEDGVVRIIKDMDEDIRDRDVVIVEDIVDTGFTLNYLRGHVLAREPASVRTVALLDKAARRILPVPVEHRGFVIPDVFALGYGLDYRALYRNLKNIVAVTDVVALARDPHMLVDALYGP